MKSKSLLIAIAAFAVTASGVQAYVGSKQLERAGFSSGQIEALAEAKELKAQGENKKARDLLLEAGLDEDKLKKLRKISHNSYRELHEAIRQGDYEKFRKLTEGTPLGDVVKSEADFLHFKQGIELRQGGKHGEASGIFTDLGLEDEHGFTTNYKYHHQNNWSDLSLYQREALMVARQSNDKETVKEILREAGLLH